MSTLLALETTHLFFFLTHPLCANKLGRDEQPGSRRLGSTQRVPQAGCHSPRKSGASLAALSPTKTLPPLGKTLRHPVSISAPKAARVPCPAERSLRPGPRRSQRVLTRRHGGRRRPPEVLEFRAAVADAALAAAGGRGGSVGGLRQLRLGRQTAPGLHLHPRCARGAACGEEAGSVLRLGPAGPDGSGVALLTPRRPGVLRSPRPWPAPLPDPRARAGGSWNRGDKPGIKPGREKTKQAAKGASGLRAGLPGVGVAGGSGSTSREQPRPPARPPHLLRLAPGRAPVGGNSRVPGSAVGGNCEPSCS